MASRRSGHVLDLLFLLGVALKGIDGLVETVAGVALVFLGPHGLKTVVHNATSHELFEDPHDLIANLIVHGTAGLSAGSVHFASAYLIVHGVVKLAILVALVFGAVRFYPWAIAALGILAIYQVVAFALHPTVGLAVLTLLDIVVIALTWREWRQHRSLRQTARATWRWMLRRPEPL